MATVHLVQPAGGWPQTGEDDAATSFGEWLRRLREARGLSLDDISHETKIPLRNLKALELGHLGVQPTFYQRAVVRAVAKAVGIDERLALDRLDTAIAPVAALPTAEVARPRIRATVSTAFVGVALGALLLTGAVKLATNESFDAAASPPPPATITPPPVAQSASVSAAVTVAPVGASPVVATAAVPDATAAVQESPASVTELVVRTDPPGAQVTVNGVGWGASPVTIRHLAPGEKHIRATKEGFGAATRVLALDGNQRRTLDLRLTTAP